MVSSFSVLPKLFGGCSTSKLLQNSGTRPPQLMNTCGFHQNVGEGNKSLNAMSPDPLLSEAFGKGSGCAKLKVRSRSLCTWENRDNFRITSLIYKILGPQRST